MTSSRNIVRAPVENPQHVVIDRSSGGFQIWAVWGMHHAADIWAGLRLGEPWQVARLQLHEPWLRALEPLIKGQSTEGLQARLPHAVVLEGGDEPEAVGPLFFPLVVHAGASALEILIPELGSRICRGPFPLFDHSIFPDKEFSMEVVKDLSF